MADLTEQMRQVAEAAHREARPPGADAAWRRGRRRRVRAAGGVLLSSVALVASAVLFQQVQRQQPVGDRGDPSAAGRALPCPPAAVAARAIACGESQGIRWEFRLIRHLPRPVLDAEATQADLELRVGGHLVGYHSSPLPTDGAVGSGGVFSSAHGRVRPVMGIASSALSDAKRVRVHFGDATTDTGLVEAVAVPVPALRAWLFAAFVPATAYVGTTEGIDALGHMDARFDGRAACSTASELPLRACRPDPQQTPRRP
jgi:hypothetical protein